MNGGLVTALCEARRWYSSPGPEVLTQIKHCSWEVCGIFAQVKVDGMVPKSRHLQGTSWVKVTADFLRERDQGPSARSAFPGLVTQTLVLLTILVAATAMKNYKYIF